MNYIVLRRDKKSYFILDFILVDEAGNRFKSHLFTRDGKFKSRDWVGNWASNSNSIKKHSKFWILIPTTASTPEEILPLYPELFI